MDSLELRVDGGLEVHMARRADSRCEPTPLESGLGESHSGGVGGRDSRTRAMLEEIDEAFVALDWEYRYVHVNEAMLRLTQRPRDELLGRVIWELFPQVQSTAVSERYRQAMELGIPSVFEHRAVVTGDWLEIRIYPTSVGVSAYYREINERKQAETRLRESQALLQAVLDGSPDPVFVKDQESRILLGNAALLEVWGKPAEEVIGKNDRELYADPAIGEAMMENDRAVMESGQSQVLEETVQTQGGLRTYLSTKSPYRNDAGETVGILGIARDISDHKRSETALRESEERFRSLFESTAEGIALHEIVYDEGGRAVDYRIIAVNPSFESQTGLLAQDARGRLASELYGTGEAPYLVEYVRVAEGGAPSCFETYFEPMQRHFHVTVTSPGRGQFATVFEDITERKRAEEALHESEERFRSMLDSTQDVLYRVNLQTGRYDYISPSCEHLVGYSPDELMALDAETSLAMVHPDDRWLLREAIATSEASGKAEATYRQRSKDGDYRWLSNRMTLTGDAAGAPLFRVGNLRDVTEARQAGQALRDSEERLATVLENSRDGINMLDLASGRYVFMNDAQVALTGFTMEEINGISAEEASERVHPDDRAISVEQQGRVAAGEDIDEPVEYRWRVKSGEYRWFSDRRKLARDEHGKPVALVGVSRDITDQKLAEEALQQELEGTSLLVEATATLTSWTDLDRMLESLGDLLLRSTGHSRVLLELWDEEHREVELAVSRGTAATAKQRFAFDGISDGAKEVITTKKSLVVDYSQTAVPTPHKEYLGEHAFLLILVVPIVYRERLAGLITLDQPGEARPFSAKEIQLVEAIASQAGAAIENARLFEAESEARQRAAQELEAAQLLLEAAGTLNRWTDLDALLNGLANVVLHATRHTRAYVALLAEDRSHATFVTTVGKDPLPARTVLTWDQLSPVLQEVLTGGRRRIVDFNELPKGQHGIADSLDSRLALHVPIVFAGRVLGHIAIDDPGERREFSDREIALIEGIAAQAAAAIENARLFEHEQQAAKLNAAFSAVDRAIHSSLEFAEIVQTALREGASILGTETASLCLHDDEAKRFRVAYGHNYPADKLGVLVSDADDTHGVEAMRTGDTLAINDTQDDPRVVREFADAWNIKSVICAPLVVRGRPIAVAYFNYHTVAHRFSEPEIEFVTKLAASLSGALENARLVEQLRDSERRFRATFELAAAGIGHRAPDGRWLMVNDRLCEMLGYTREELLSRTLADVTEPDDLLADQTHIEELQAGRAASYTLEKRYRRKDGQLLWGSLSATLVRDAAGEPDYFISVIEDVSQRKQADEERHQQAALRYARRLIESSLDPLVTISAEGKITDVNDATERVTGVGRDELIGSDFSDYFTEPEQARAGYLQVFAEGSVVDYPLAIRHRDGSVRDVLYNASLYRNEAGEVAGVFAAARDITERKRAEQTALQNARLFEEQKRIAVTLQENLIHPLPAVDGLELGVVSLTANEPELVGGDLSDVFVVDEAHVVVLVGDVAGKGVRAAGLTETVRSTVRALATIDPSPSFVLAKTNELLLRFDPGESHVTAFLAVLDPHTGHLSYASAGHPAPIHLGGFTCRPLDVTFGPPLGTFERPYANGHAMLTLEDYLVLYTDGVTEARRGTELLGERRLLEIVAGLRGRSAQEVAEGVRDAALAFASQLRDDVQVVVLRLD
jgi:PAS domain S-box-containing protein